MSKCIVTNLAGIATTLYQITIPSGHKLRVEGRMVIDGTGSFTLPSGTTAQRPASASTGDLRFNTDEGGIEVYDGSGLYREKGQKLVFNMIFLSKA